MLTIPVEKAETQLATLLDQVAAGEEVMITRADGATFKIIQLEPVSIRPKFGSAKGLVSMADDLPHSPSLPLTEATVQDIQLELIRRTDFEAFHGEQIVRSLLQHRELWIAVMLERFCIDKPGQLPILGLIKLRDLPENFWNADTLFILTHNIATAERLAEIAETEDWGGMVQLHTDPNEVMAALGSGGDEYAVVSIWWD